MTIRLSVARRALFQKIVEYGTTLWKRFPSWMMLVRTKYKKEESHGAVSVY
ncbi:hypothetical protein Plhal304r1_c010g0039651 [Plasmopara halstedii]